MARFAALLGLVVNLLLAVVKVATGLAGQSFALICDGIHSATDLVTSGAVYVGLRIAQRPADAEHPYGHARAESLVGLAMAGALVLSAGWIAWETVKAMLVQHRIPATFTFYVAGATVVVKEALYQYKVRLGRRINSLSIIADAWHHRSDAFSSLAVTVGLGFVIFGGPRFGGADDVAALVVAVSILWAATRLLRKSTDELMDRQADTALLERIRRAALSVQGVTGVEKVFARKSGLEYSIDIHIEVTPELTVRTSHDIAVAVTQRLPEVIPAIKNVLVHVEPNDLGTNGVGNGGANAGSAEDQGCVAVGGAGGGGRGPAKA